MCKVEERAARRASRRKYIGLYGEPPVNWEVHHLDSNVFNMNKDNLMSLPSKFHSALHLYMDYNECVFTLDDVLVLLQVVGEPKTYVQGFRGITRYINTNKVFKHQPLITPIYTWGHDYDKAKT